MDGTVSCHVVQSAIGGSVIFFKVAFVVIVLNGPESSTAAPLNDKTDDDGV